jgi:hypothetical protein
MTHFQIPGKALLHSRPHTGGEIPDAVNPVELLWKFEYLLCFITVGDWLFKMAAIRQGKAMRQFNKTVIQIILVSLFYE